MARLRRGCGGLALGSAAGRIAAIGLLRRGILPSAGIGIVARGGRTRLRFGRTCGRLATRGRRGSFSLAGCLSLAGPFVLARLASLRPRLRLRLPLVSCLPRSLCFACARCLAPRAPRVWLSALSGRIAARWRGFALPVGLRAILR